MNEAPKTEKKTAAVTMGGDVRDAFAEPQKREGIRVAQLLIAGANPQGIRVPQGNAKGDGGSNHMAHTIVSGERGDLKTEIEYRPWMRHFRVACARKHTKQIEKNQPEAVFWEPERPYFIHEAHIGSWMPLED